MDQKCEKAESENPTSVRRESKFCEIHETDAKNGICKKVPEILVGLNFLCIPKY